MLFIASLNSKYKFLFIYLAFSRDVHKERIFSFIDHLTYMLNKF